MQCCDYFIDESIERDAIIKASAGARWAADVHLCAKGKLLKINRVEANPAGKEGPNIQRICTTT